MIRIGYPRLTFFSSEKSVHANDTYNILLLVLLSRLKIIKIDYIKFKCIKLFSAKLYIFPPGLSYFCINIFFFHSNFEDYFKKRHYYFVHRVFGIVCNAFDFIARPWHLSYKCYRVCLISKIRKRIYTYSAKWLPCCLLWTYICFRSTRRAMRENFNYFGALLEMASFSFLDFNFQNKHNSTKKMFPAEYHLGPTARL